MRILLGLLVALCTTWLPAVERLPALPDDHGFAGMFAGVSNGTLLVAGGANFPDKKPWEGGTKVWYDRVFALSSAEGEWRDIGKLPRPLGYGVSVTHANGVICVGGSDAARHYADVFCVEWKAGKLIVKDLPALPQPLANAAGALVGDALFVVGGQEAPDSKTASAAVWKLELLSAKPRWERVADCPGSARIFPVAAEADGALWIAGGAELVTEDGKAARRYLADAYRFDLHGGWKRIADLPAPVVAAPSPAPVDAKGLYLLGGDDGSQVGADPRTHRGFGSTILRYDLHAEKWQPVGRWNAPRVTAPCVLWNGKWIVPSGEVRPGVRSPEVQAVSLIAEESER